MKKIMFCLVIVFTISVAAPLSVRAVSQGDFCDPKKMDECYSKIDNLVGSIDSLRAKLIKTKAELKAGKKLTNEEADRLLKKMDEMQKTIPSTEGNMWDY
jgi:outer membrane murein-binding lipoprotein Lpp